MKAKKSRYVRKSSNTYISPKEHEKRRKVIAKMTAKGKGCAEIARHLGCKRHYVANAITYMKLKKPVKPSPIKKVIAKKSKLSDKGKKALDLIKQLLRLAA